MSGEHAHVTLCSPGLADLTQQSSPKVIYTNTNNKTITNILIVIKKRNCKNIKILLLLQLLIKIVMINVIVKLMKIN